MIHYISRFIAALALLATAQGAWAAWTGTGYKSSPYIISTPEDLLLLAHRVNGTNGETANDYQGKYFKLGADITFSHAADEPSNYAENYEAIGCRVGGTDRFFKGDFDGDGHTVSGIRIRKTSSNYQGLFGYIGSGANIHDVHLTDARITGNYSVGGIVGHTYGGYIMGCSVTDSYITANDNLRYGTICGSTIITNRLTNNYYHGCTVNGTAVTSGKGCGGSDIADITANNGALPAYRLDLGDGVTIQTTMAADLGFSCDADNNGTAENYWRSGAVLTLGYTGTVPAGYLFDGLTATNGTVGGNANDGYTLTMPDQDAAITAAKTPDPAHFSVNDAGTEYTILTATGWNVFCDCLNDNDTYNRFSGKTVQLGADITVTRMAGSTGHEFAGTFDGGGYTLTVSITGTVQGTAPFCEIKGATIRNLVVTGSVAGMRHSAGLVGFARGDEASVENTIENCLVATNVSIKDDDYGYLGGIVGHGLQCKLTIRGCAFTGSLTSGSYYTGGLQGWSDGNTLILENDIFAASSVNAANVGFHPIAIHVNNASTTATVSNVYYTVAPTCTTSTRIAAAGKQAHTVAAGENVTIKAVALTGTATQYTVSGITAYSGGGLQRGQTLYYGSDDQLSLTLSNSATGAPQGYQYGYTASAGTLSGTTLTMPDDDVTISVALAPIDWATVNKGDSKYPYMIYNKDQLLLLAHRVNGTNGETANDYQGKYFKLGADITFDPNDLTLDEGQSNYEAIGGNIGGTERFFNGNFDGDGHTVSGIRICKDGTGDADFYQGLFGQIGSHANIHDVHLTDARITGCYYVGGIVGFKTSNSIVSGCTVTNSHITATGQFYGTICGFNADGTLRNNYYHGCTVNSTAVTSGKGCEGADIADDNGALPAYAITLGDGVSTTVLASEPENGFVKGGISYYRMGLALPLASEAPEGYTLSFSAKGTALSGNTYTVNATDGDVTINTALRSDGLEHEVNYMTADGTTQTAKAIALDGHEAVDGNGNVHLAAGTYYVGTDITYANQIVPDGMITLILADGKNMTLNGNTYGINRGLSNLIIYGQSLDAATAGTLRYNGSSCGIDVYSYVQHSGNVSITTTGSSVYGIISKVTLRGGTLTISANGNKSYAIYGQRLSILGGQLTANATGDNATGIYALTDDITLGWTRPADRITASSISTQLGTVAVKDGQALTDGSGNIYTGTLTADDLAALAGKTLQPWLVLNETAGVTPLTTFAGQANVPVIFTRTFTRGVASTVCLPFAISADQATAAGKFYTFAGVDMSGSDWVVTMQKDDPSNLASGELAANTPYLFMPSSSSEVIFSGTIGNVADTYTAGTTTSGDWTYKGTYETIEWKSDPDNIYGFASGQAYGDSGDQTEAGKFIRVHTGGIRPFRAYLQYSGAGNARALTRSANDGLPETMTVRLIGSNGQTTAIGTLDTRTGDVTFGDEWYTLDGRRLPAKPTAKGLYINKGNKVFIK